MKIKGDCKNSLSAEEMKIKNVLLMNSKLQECFVGYYYDGIHSEKDCIRIDKSVINY